MTLARIHTRAQVGIEAPEVTVEVHLANGLPGLSIVGLPEAAVKESKDRVRGALLTSQFEFPARRITINLAPADLPKEGGRFDLPIALGILAASGQVPRDALENHEFLGELALSGELRPVRGALPAALAARDAGRQLVVPETNAGEAALVNGAVILPATHLLAVCAHLHGQETLPRQPKPDWDGQGRHPDLADVRGQHHAKRALEIAAAGGHSLLMLGPPGTGKTMLARRLPGLLPEMTDDEAIEAAAVASISGQGLQPEQWRVRPFRAPHHTASAAALVGGGCDFHLNLQHSNNICYIPSSSFSQGGDDVPPENRNDPPIDQHRTGAQHTDGGMVVRARAPKQSGSKPAIRGSGFS